jgi:hypothetical protein
MTLPNGGNLTKELSPELVLSESRTHLDQGQLVTCNLSELRPHPSYLRLRLSVSVSKLSALAEQGGLAFREPLVVTRERAVIDGYARWELARLKGWRSLPCIEYDLTDEQALRWLLQKHRRSNGMNDFCRILLALELEPCLREKAQSNQRFGGRMKGSSNLTEDAALDVRQEIARAVGVSVGNVTKVKQLLRKVPAELFEALRSGEVSIHRAWKWSTLPPDRQIDALRSHRNEKGVNKAIRDLISRHGAKPRLTAPDMASIIGRLSGLTSEERSSVGVSSVKTPGKMIFVTEELLQSLPAYQESIPTCRPDNR